MKVMFINPPNVPFTEKSLLIEPIDILTAASYVEILGHDVKVVDMDVKQMHPEEIHDVAQKFLPEVTVIPFDYHIPLHTSDSIGGINKIISIVKKFDSKIIVAGKTAKYFPEVFINQGAEVVIRGEIELVLQELLNIDDWSNESLCNIRGIAYRTNNEIVSTGKTIESFNLNALPIVDRKLVDLNDYNDVRTILSSRGCVGKCGFCPTPDFWGKWRERSAQSVVDEIEYLVKNFNAQKILFLDDNSTVNKVRMREISQQMVDRGIKATLGCLGTIQNYDRKTLEMMYNAGFRWIHYGVETASQSVLEKNGKFFDIEYAKKVINETKEIGFIVRTSFILDLPGINEDGIEKTSNFIIETQPHEIRLHYLTLRAGTKIYNQLANKNLLPSQYIHSDKPNYGDLYIKEKIKESVEILTQKLKQKGYIIVTKAEQFRKLENVPNLKFVSFCPSKYGLNWGNVK